MKKQSFTQKKNLELKFNFFDCDLVNFDTEIKFDCIIFRGTFQYLSTDLCKSMKKLNQICSKNSKIIILSLPNSDSFLYKILKNKWHLFHKLEHTLIFNRKSLYKLCEIYGYRIIELSYPYLETPYANITEDYENLIKLILDKKQISFPFWGNIIQVVLEKL